MASFGDVGLVVAGAAGPLVAALVSNRSTRKASESAMIWERDRDRERDYTAAVADFMGDVSVAIVELSNTSVEDMNDGQVNAIRGIQHSAARALLLSPPIIRPFVVELVDLYREAHALSRAHSSSDAFSEIARQVRGVRTRLVEHFSDSRPVEW